MGGNPIIARSLLSEVATRVAPLPSLIAWDPAHGKSLRFLGCDGYGELVQTPLFVALFVRHKVSGRGSVGTAFQAGRPKGAKRPLLDFSAGLKASTPTPAYLSSARLANLGAKGRELRLLLVRKTCAARLASIQPFTFQGRSPLTLNSNKA